MATFHVEVTKVSASPIRARSGEKLEPIAGRRDGMSLVTAPTRLRHKWASRRIDSDGVNIEYDENGAEIMLHVIILLRMIYSGKDRLGIPRWLGASFICCRGLSHAGALG